jgi:predicted nucleotidyltransferase
MTKQEALAVLRKYADELRARGIVHAALFGSVARGEATEASDIDILMDLDENRRFGLFEYAGLTSFVEGLFPGPVDVVDRLALKPDLREPVMADAVHAS